MKDCEPGVSWVRQFHRKVVLPLSKFRDPAKFGHVVRKYNDAGKRDLLVELLSIRDKANEQIEAIEKELAKGGAAK
ncbi:MAG: hypothetical protein MOB07_16410 [Acidobacteria bacterium]|nr:hypothetical protein [Acidobacteriota bacterium]